MSIFQDAVFEAQYKRLLEASGAKTDAELARLLGVQPPSIVGAKKRKNIPKTWTEMVAKQFGVSLDWLMWGREVRDKGITPASERFADNSLKKTPLTKINNKAADTLDVEMLFIPLVEAHLSAGKGSLETSSDSERKYGFRSDFLHRKGNPDRMVLMRIAGDSMEPEIKNGDVVLLDQSKTRILPGRMFAVGFEEAIYIKRVDMLPGKVILKSDNPAYAPVECDVRGDCADQFRVIGQVLWVGREY